MLAVSGLELAVVAQRSFVPAEASAMLVTAAVGLALNSPAWGLLAGLLLWLCQRPKAP